MIEQETMATNDLLSTICRMVSLRFIVDDSEIHADGRPAGKSE